MKLHFIFPSHPFEASATEEIFASQLAALREAGFSTSLCPESVIRDGKRLRNVPVGSTVVYRSWMLNMSEYERLIDAILVAGATPLTSRESYLSAHHLPNWYPLVKEFSPETIVIPETANHELEMRSFGWDSFFIKDYVKSLKTSLGSIVRDPSQISAVVAEMEKFRGEIEGGLCIRRVEPFVVDTEERHFVLDGKAYSANNEPAPDMVQEIATRIPSPFYSVDVVRRTDGAMRLVEIGDGQVSDLVGWSASEFAAMWVASQLTG